MDNEQELFDRALRALADEADAAVDYDAMRRAIEEKIKAKTVKTRSFARYGAMAAAAVLLCAVGAFALRAGIKEAPVAEAPMAAAPAADAAPAAPAPAMFAMEAPEDASEAALEAAPPVYDTATTAESATAENGAESAAGAAAAGSNAKESRAGFNRQAMRADYYTQLVNRENPLTEDYVPNGLVEVQAAGVEYKKEGIMANAIAAEAFARMMEGAAEEGVTGFYLSSAYRTYEEQAAIWGNKIGHDPHYGENGAPVASMPPGQSEHQTGLAFDITCTAHPSMSAGYADTPQAEWLAAHAHEYGFILRYPKGSEEGTGVIFEPWHFRYVGEELSLYLFEAGLTLEAFYEN